MVDILSQRRYRRAAALRMSPISSCGCIRDPDVDVHVCDGGISDVMVEAAADAIVLLDSLGTPGLLDRATCQALWRAGRRDLAVSVFNRTAGIL